ncbi:MAG: hypothetical protein ACYC8T_09485 [Myxococcaceae bacterium]
MPARVKHPAAPASPSATKRTERAAPAAKTSEVKNTVKADRFSPLRAALAATAGPTAEAAAPALLRALFGAAEGLKAGEGQQQIAVDAARMMLASPEMLAAFKHALPALEAAAKAVAGTGGLNVAKAVLPLVANGQTVKAILKLATEVAGPVGRRLAGAAMRGLTKGGLTPSAAEIAATAAKIGMKSGATKGAAGLLAKGLGKAAPIVGNAVNILSVGGSLIGLIKSLRDPEATAGGKLAHVLHLACTITGCFIPPVGIVGDLALAGADMAGVK